MATSTQINAITALYVGYFDRAPDPAGLQFWIDQIDNGREFNTIAADFAASPEAVALYPYLTTPAVSSPAAFITSIYANLFGRAPDAEGLEFWTGVLQDGSVSVADMIEAIIMGARDDAAAGTFDKSVLDNKVEVGLDFAVEAGNVAGFEFNAAAKAAAVAAVNGVTEDQATVDAAKAATDAFVTNGTVSGTVGETFTLTAGSDNLVGTANADTFQAIELGGVSDTTLTAFDKLDGGAGADTLELIVTGDLDLPGGLSIKNIETINLSRSGAAPTTAVNASTFVGSTQIWQIDNAGAVNNLVDGQTAGFRNTTVEAADVVTYKDGATTASVALDNVADAGTVTVAGDDIETVNVSGTIDAAAATITVDLGADGAGADAVTALNLSLSSDTTITLAGTNAEELKTFDASGSTGGISFSTNSGPFSNDLETVLTGSGDDVVYFDNDFGPNGGDGGGTVTIDTGAGNDDVSYAAYTNSANTAASITLGEGNDVLKIVEQFVTFDNSEANFMDGIITVEDFNTAEDVLDVSATATGEDVLTNVELASIATASSLFAAVELAAAATNISAVSKFDYDGDAYVFKNNAGAGFDDGDGLLKLVGVSEADLDSSAFFA